jgi:Fic family protein
MFEILCAGARKKRKISENYNISTFMSTEKKKVLETISKEKFFSNENEKVNMEKEEGKNRNNLCIFRYNFIMEKSHVFFGAAGEGWMSLVEMAAIKS